MYKFSIGEYHFYQDSDGFWGCTKGKKADTPIHCGYKYLSELLRLRGL